MDVVKKDSSRVTITCLEAPNIETGKNYLKAVEIMDQAILVNIDSMFPFIVPFICEIGIVTDKPLPGPMERIVIIINELITQDNLSILAKGLLNIIDERENHFAIYIFHRPGSTAGASLVDTVDRLLPEQYHFDSRRFVVF